MESVQIIARIFGTITFLIIGYYLYIQYFKKEKTVAKPIKITSGILGIFFLLIGIGSFLFMIISMFVSEITTSLEINMLLIINIILFGTLGTYLILSAKGKW